MRFIYDLFGRFYERGFFRGPVQYCYELRWWQFVFHHEAGHAVASLALWNTSADIVAEALADEDGVTKRKATFRHTLTPLHFGQHPLNATILTAAGAQAERLFFHRPSDGFMKDKSIIDAGISCLSAQNRQQDVNLLRLEMQDNYPNTFIFLQQHERAIGVIGRTGYRRFLTMNRIGRLFPNTVILTSADVQHLYQSNS